VGKKLYEYGRGKFQINNPDRLFDFWKVDKADRPQLFNELKEDNYWGKY
jgi:hypothetical protein